MFLNTCSSLIKIDKNRRILTEITKTLASTVSKIHADHSNLTTTLNHTISTNNFTIEIWIYIPSSSVQFQMPIFSIFSASTTGIILYYNHPQNTNKLRLETLNPANSHNFNTILNTNRWYHVALTRQNNILNLYIDGIIDTLGNITFSFSIGTKFSLFRNINNSDSCFFGCISQFSISKSYYTNFNIESTYILNPNDDSILIVSCNRGTIINSVTGGNPLTISNVSIIRINSIDSHYPSYTRSGEHSVLFHNATANYVSTGTINIDSTITSTSTNTKYQYNPFYSLRGTIDLVSSGQVVKIGLSVDQFKTLFLNATGFAFSCWIYLYDKLSTSRNNIDNGKPLFYMHYGTNVAELPMTIVLSHLKNTTMRIDIKFGASQSRGNWVPAWSKVELQYDNILNNWIHLVFNCVNNSSTGVGKNYLYINNVSQTLSRVEGTAFEIDTNFNQQHDNYKEKSIRNIGTALRYTDGDGYYIFSNHLSVRGGANMDGNKKYTSFFLNL